jgi:hypothetical protein
MDKGFADLMLAVLAMVTALLISLAIGWHNAKANPDWRTVPMVHASNGPVVAR